MQLRFICHFRQRRMGGGGLGFQRENRQFTGRWESEHVKFFLSHSKTAVPRGKCNKQALLGISLYATFSLYYDAKVTLPLSRVFY